MVRLLSRPAVLAAASVVVSLAFFTVLDGPISLSSLRPLCCGNDSQSKLRHLYSSSCGGPPCDGYAQEASQGPRLGQVIHTFFEPIDRKTRGSAESVPANGTDARTLRVWRDAWEGQGWMVRVLTLEDARHHPDFATYDAALNDVPLGGNAYYNRLCFLRWLAMAAAGGGFMSDFDVIPTIQPSVVSGGGGNGGDSVRRAIESDRFVSFGGSVPSLLHGSSTEWTRMAHLLLETAKKGEAVKVGRFELFSDMMALQALRNPPGEHYDMGNEVLQSHDDFRSLVTEPMTAGRQYTNEECTALLQKYMAVHFSHVTVAEALGVDPWNASGKGSVSLQEKLSDRPIMIKTWTEMFKECEKRGERTLTEGVARK